MRVVFFGKLGLIMEEEHRIKFFFLKGEKLYLFFKLGFQPQSIPRDPRMVGSVKIKVGLSSIVEPYYFAESNQVGSIFEKSPKTPIQDRKWIHFLKFNKSYQGEQILLKKNDQKMIFSFWDKICDSGNIGGGSPRELTDSEADFFDSFLKGSI